MIVCWWSQRPEFLLFSALCTLINDSDDDARAALEGLLCLVQLPSARVSRYVVQDTDFAQRLVRALVCADRVCFVLVLFWPSLNHRAG